MLIFYVRTQISWGNNILCGMYKKDKKTPYLYLEHQNLSFFTRDTKNILFSENLCVNIECLNIHANIYFRIFRYFKMYFHKTSSYALVSRIEFPLYKGLITGYQM
jgi:hypothetical protein